MSRKLSACHFFNSSRTRDACPGCEYLTKKERARQMHLTNKVKEMGATGYILLWLLGIPIPILLLIFLLRGCT